MRERAAMLIESDYVGETLLRKDLDKIAQVIFEETAFSKFLFFVIKAEQEEWEVFTDGRGCPGPAFKEVVEGFRIAGAMIENVALRHIEGFV